MNWTKYLLAFVLTLAIFGTAYYVTARFNTERLADIQASEDALSTDLLSSEVQFELLGNTTDCEALAQSPILADELNSLASRLSVAESNLGSTDPQVLLLKKQYSLIEIKDYILLKKLQSQCNKKPVYILYFYSNAGDCPECGNEGDVLTYLRQRYPDLRVYSFDYNLDLSALRTLVKLQDINGSNLPALVIDGRPAVYGFKDLAAMQKLVPELKTLSAATSTAQ